LGIVEAMRGLDLLCRAIKRQRKDNEMPRFTGKTPCFLCLVANIASSLHVMRDDISYVVLMCGRWLGEAGDIRDSAKRSG